MAVKVNIEGCDKPFTEGNPLPYFSFLRSWTGRQEKRRGGETMTRMTIMTMRRRRRMKLIPRTNERSKRQEERGESLASQCITSDWKSASADQSCLPCWSSSSSSSSSTASSSPSSLLSSSSLVVFVAILMIDLRWPQEIETGDHLCVVINKRSLQMISGWGVRRLIKMLR